MDRRSLYFVMALSLLFLGLNVYFADAPITPPKNEQIEKLEAAPSLDRLTSLFYSEEGSKSVKDGAIGQNGTYILCSKKNLPATLWTAQKEALSQQLSLETDDFTFYIYAHQSSFSLPSSSLPSGPAIVYLYAPGHKAAAYLYQGKVHLLEKWSANHALIFGSAQNGVIPFLGLWDGEKITPASTIANLGSHLQQYPLLLHTTPFPYILENEAMQIVFSPIDGSIVEINLPFASKDNSLSVIKPIAFDRMIAKESPQNNLFPLQPAWKVIDGKRELVLPSQGGYYPLLRRPTVKNFEQLPQTTYRNFLPVDSKNGAELISFSENQISYRHKGDLRSFQSSYVLPKAADLPYCFELRLSGSSDAKEFWLATAPLEVELVSNSYTPVLENMLPKKGSYSIKQISLPKETPAVYSAMSPLWVASSNSFFAILTQPLPQNSLTAFKAVMTPGEMVPPRISLIDAQFDRYPAKDYPSYSLSLNLKQKPIDSTIRVFAGPLDKDILKTVDKTIEKEDGSNPGFVSAMAHFGFFAFISEPFSKCLFLVMEFFHFFTRSWGLSIILLTAVLRLLLYPFNSWSMKSAAKSQALAPELKMLQQKYKNDPKQLQLKTIQLYKIHGVNPISGCLPLLIQMPFLVGMFDLLKTHFPLRGASFIPGWIPDLTAPDVLFSWSFPIPLIGTQFHLLPILLGAVTLLQQKLPALLKGVSPSSMTEQERSQQTMFTMMALVFAVMFYHFPSGLNIYWIFSTLFGIAQQIFTTQRSDFLHQWHRLIKIKKK